MYPDNGKDMISLLVSPHIFLQTEALQSEPMSYLKKWLYNPEAFARTKKMNEFDEILEETHMEPSFIDKLTEMFKLRYAQQNIKTEKG